MAFITKMEFVRELKTSTARLVCLLRYAFQHGGRVITRKTSIRCPVTYYFYDFLEDIDASLVASEWFLCFSEYNLEELCDFLYEIREQIRRLKSKLHCGSPTTTQRWTSTCNSMNCALISAFYIFRTLLMSVALPDQNQFACILDDKLLTFVNFLSCMQNISSAQSIYLKLNPIKFQVMAMTCKSRTDFVQTIMNELGYDTRKLSKSYRRIAKSKRASKENVVFRNLLFRRTQK